MFDVGFAELFLLALIGLMVLGPERLPGVARTVGGFVRKARTSWISLRNSIESELAEADISAPIKQTSEELKQIGKDLMDMPAFTAEDREPNRPEPNAQADAEQKSDPADDDSNSGKDKNA